MGKHYGEGLAPGGKVGNTVKRAKISGDGAIQSEADNEAVSVPGAYLVLRSRDSRDLSRYDLWVAMLRDSPRPRTRRLTFGAVAALLTLMIGHACSSSDSDSGGDFGPPQGDAGEDAGLDRYAADTALPNSDSNTPSDGADELCGGDLAPCDPEVALSCTADDGASAGGAGEQSSELSACQVQVGDGGATTGCQPAGVGVDGDPCVSPADCAPGLTCTGESGASQCRLYCCSSSNVCPEDSFCTQRSLRDVGVQAAPRVPVCVPAIPCGLDEPFPCDPELNGVCACHTGTACMVVRDGLASCATPGDGVAGALCPCAPGHVCSQTIGTCLKLCHLSGVVDDECGDGECQSTSSIPDGYGVCVGGTAQEG